MSDLLGGLFGFGGGESRRNKGKDLVYEYPVTLSDLYNGKVAKLSLRKNAVCTSCKGTGGLKPDSIRNCKECHGRGMKVTIRQMGGMIQQLQQVCPQCRGAGEIVKDEERCKSCGGNKVIPEKKILELYIDKGMKDGEQIRFNGEGDQVPGLVEPGDVVAVLRCKPHHSFEREGTNLYIKKEITLYEALCGTKFDIKHLDGRILRVSTVDPADPESGVIKPGDKKEIPGQGMPVHKNPFERGVMAIVFDVIFPKTRLDGELLSKVLPTKLDQDGKMEAEDGEEKSAEGVVEEVILKEFGSTERVGRSRKEVYTAGGDEDDDEDGGSQVRCAQQ